MALSEPSAGRAASRVAARALTERDVDAAARAVGCRRLEPDRRRLGALHPPRPRRSACATARQRWVATAAAPALRQRPAAGSRWCSSAEAWRHRGLASRLARRLRRASARRRHRRRCWMRRRPAPPSTGASASCPASRSTAGSDGASAGVGGNVACAERLGAAAPVAARRRLRPALRAGRRSPTSTPSSLSTAPRPASIAASCSRASCRGPRPGLASRRWPRLRHRPCRPARDPDRPARGARRRAGGRPARRRHRRAAAGDAGRTIFLDLPRAHRTSPTGSSARGFVRQRPFVRMALGATERAAPRRRTVRSRRPGVRLMPPSRSTARPASDLAAWRDIDALRVACARPRDPGASARARCRRAARSRVASAP